jgi:hypothetical protein
MQDQIIELLNGITFKFDILSEGIATFNSITPVFINGNQVDYEVSVHYNSKDFITGYMTFNELIDMHTVFEVNEITNDDKEEKLWIN